MAVGFSIERDGLVCSAWVGMRVMQVDDLVVCQPVEGFVACCSWVAYCLVRVVDTRMV